jgi:hypothetical protein
MRRGHEPLSSSPISIKDRPGNGERCVQTTHLVCYSLVLSCLLAGAFHRARSLHRRRNLHVNEHRRRRSAHSSEPRVRVLAMDDCDIDPRKGRSRVTLTSRVTASEIRTPPYRGNDLLSVGRSLSSPRRCLRDHVRMVVVRGVIWGCGILLVSPFAGDVLPSIRRALFRG